MYGESAEPSMYSYDHEVIDEGSPSTSDKSRVEFGPISMSMHFISAPSCL